MVESYHMTSTPKVMLLKLPLFLDASSTKYRIIGEEWKPDEKPPNPNEVDERRKSRDQ